MFKFKKKHKNRIKFDGEIVLKYEFKEKKKRQNFPLFVRACLWIFKWVMTNIKKHSGVIYS